MAAGLQLLIEIDDRGTPKVTKFQNNWNRMKRNVLGGTASMAKAWTQAKAAWGGLERRIQRGVMYLKFALAGLVAATLVVGAKFEQSMAKVASVAGGIGEEFKRQLRELTMVARAWGAKTAFSASQVADAMYSLASAGQSTIEIIKSVGGVLMFAGAGATSMGEAAETVVQTLKMFHLRAGQTNRIVNVLAAGISKSMLTADRLKESLANVGISASSMNLAVEETVALLGLLHNAGMLGGIAGTYLKNVLVNLAKPNKELRDLLGDVTLETHGFAGVMQHLADTTTDVGRIYAAFNRRGAPAVLEFMKLGRRGIEELTDAVTGTQKAWEMYEQQQDTVIGDFKRFKSAIEESMIATFETLRPTIRETLQTLTRWIGTSRKYIVGTVAATIQWVDENKKLVVSLAKTAGKAMLAVVAFQLLVMFGKGAIVVWTLMTPVVKLAALAFAGLHKALNLAMIKMAGLQTVSLRALGPVALVAAALLAISYGIQRDLMNMSERYKEFSEKLSLALKDTLLGTIKGMGAEIGGLIGDIFSSLDSKFNLGLGGLEEQFKGFMENLNKAIAQAEIALPEVGLDLMAEPKIPPTFAMGTLPIGVEIDEKSFKALHRFEGEYESMLSRVRGAEINYQQERAIQSVAADMRIAEFGGRHTQEWLQKKIELAQMAEQSVLDNTKATIEEKAAAVIAKEAEIANATMMHQEAVWQHWQATHQAEMMFLASLEDGYDTFFATLDDAQMSAGERWKSMCKSMKQSLIRNTGEMIKFYVKNWIKGLIVAEAASQKFALKEKFTQAKLGAVKAYQAFAAIPLIGPALGAAAAAAAFAFLIAFHKGGLVGALGPREQVALVERGEHVTRRSSVTPETLPVLQMINRTGRAPAQTTNIFELSFYGAGIDPDEIQAYLEDEVAPGLEDLINRRRFKVATA